LSLYENFIYRKFFFPFNVESLPKRYIKRRILELSFPQSLSGNPDVVPAKLVPAGGKLGAGNYKRYWIPVFTGIPGCPIIPKAFGKDMTEALNDD